MTDPEFRKGFEEHKQELVAMAKIRKLRTEAGLSQADVAKIMGTSQPAVARLENKLAHGELPSMSSLKRYAQAIGKRLDVRFI